MPGTDEINHLPENRVAFIVASRVVSPRLQRPHLVSPQAEQEKVLFPDFLPNFNVCTVQCSDGQRPVHGEFHVPGTGRLLAGQGDLLGQVRRRIYVLAVLDVEVRQEDHLEPAMDIGVAVHHISHRIDELDDEFCRRVSRRSLAAKDERPGNTAGCGVAFQPRVERHDMQDVQVLALVFVQALDLYVEKGRRVDHDSGTQCDQICQVVLVFPLDAAPLRLELLVIGTGLEPFQFIEAGNPAVTDRPGNEGGKPRIGKHHPAAWRDAIGHVMEFPREQFVEIMQHLPLEKLRVEPGHAVDRMASHAGEMGHPHGAAP